MEFIFENPIFIIVIIGMITSFIKRLKGTKASEPSKEPDWKKMMNFPQMFDEPRQEVSSPSKEQQVTKSKLAQEYYEHKQTTEITKTRNTPRKESTSQRKEVEVRNKVEEKVGFSQSKENIIDGVIWAEILGPPRANKSHSHRRTYRR